MTKQRLIPKFQFGGLFSSDRQANLIQRTIRPSPIKKLIPPTLSKPLDNTLKHPTLRQGSAVTGGIANGVGGGMGMVADLAGDMVESFAKPGKTNSWGITDPNAKATKAVSTLKEAGKWAGMGASIGSVFPGLGTVIGAGVGLLGGAVAGLFKGKKKVKADKKEYLDSTQAAYENYNQKAAAQQYAALAKHGTKLAIMNKIKSGKTNAISWHDKKFKKDGGKLDKVGEVNIIPSGTLHKENNNLGQKDKGIPIIDKDGKKIFEVEREELILRLKTTKEVESLVDKYKRSNNKRHLIDLGKLLSKEIMTNTHDFSGKFGMEVE